MANGYDRWLEFQYHQSGGFVHALFEAIMRADADNRARLARGFPEEVEAVRLWTNDQENGIQTVFNRCTPGPLVDQARKEHNVDETDYYD